MRVAYVCADPGVPVFGSKGSSVHVQSVLRALRRRNARVELLACRTGGPPPDDLDGITLHPLPRPPHGDAAERELLALAANGALATALEQLGPLDLIYERCSLWSFAALAHARRQGIPSVLEVNAPLVEEQARHRVLVDRAAAERVAALQARDAGVLAAVSEGVAAALRRRHPASAGRVHVIPNGVDPERFRTQPGNRAGRPFTVGFLGTLKPWHGVDVLVDAFARLRYTVPEARLLVVGDGPERETLEAGLAAHGAAAAARLTGSVPPGAVPELLAGMDVAVAPYPPQAAFYFSPLKVVEAMAAGLPVVASRVGQIQELVADGRTGTLVPPGDAAALAAALADLAARPERRAELGAAARRAVLATRTWDVVVARVLELAGSGT